MGYNTSFLNTSTGVMDTVTGVNNMTEGLYAALILFVIFLVMLIAMKKIETDAAFLTSSFTVSVIATLFFIMELIGIEIYIIPLVLLLIAVFIKTINNGG